MARGTMVLSEDSTRKEFEEAVTKLGFEMMEELPSQSETDPYVSNWISQDKKHHLQYIEEPRLGTNFVLLETTNLSYLGQYLGNKLFWDGIDELFYEAEYATTHEEGVKALFRLTAGIYATEDLPPRAKHLYSEYLAQEHWMTRRAAVQALAYGGWAEGLPILEQVAREDPDERVREFASLQVSDLKKQLGSDGTSG